MPTRTSSPNPDTPHSELAEAHHRLRELVQEVEHTTDLAALVPLLKDLRAQFAEHFADEEAPDGLARAIGEAAPQPLRKLDQLFQEHKKMLATVSRLIERTQALLDGPAAGIHDDVRKLGRAFRTHEQAETELLMDSVYSDVGSGD